MRERPIFACLHTVSYVKSPTNQNIKARMMIVVVQMFMIR